MKGGSYVYLKKNSQYPYERRRLSLSGNAGKDQPGKPKDTNKKNT